MQRVRDMKGVSDNDFGTRPGKLRARKVVEAMPAGSQSKTVRRRYCTANSRERRDATMDAAVRQGGKEKTARMDCGLTLFVEVHALPGVFYTRQEIAGWAGCTDVGIYQIERKVMAVLEARIGRELFEEWMRSVQDERRPAMRTPARRAA